ncbi:TetR/AcrR family transcriptional regulator [Nocardia cyriacigeorgica]|uniref:TetR/AcrR family transcriptional regulator n=1 Tax=Nocardia cyriacigeorgica TaxID=135487 RepID=UPI000CEB54E7|nr:TetR/AcrR family transcriptional regulator [Nocardia cyriacigeorgica]AVH22453.1 TetR family transcriptional regulator [Nocardia cyriacigeorgica]
MAQHRRDWLAGGDRRAAAVARIEAAATELFLERGIDDVGVDQVAARAGCSRATLYRHVGGKAALVDAVLARSAATVSERVAAAVAPHTGARRVVEAILASVAAIRADPVLSRWPATRSAAGDSYLTASPVLSRIASTLTGTTDDEAAQWIVRVVLSLLTWALPDAAAERRLVQRFVARVSPPVREACLGSASGLRPPARASAGRGYRGTSTADPRPATDTSRWRPAM